VSRARAFNNLFFLEVPGFNRARKIADAAVRG